MRRRLGNRWQNRKIRANEAVKKPVSEKRPAFLQSERRSKVVVSGLPRVDANCLPNLYPYPEVLYN